MSDKPTSNRTRTTYDDDVAAGVRAAEERRAAAETRPQLTMTMTLHLNGGSKFSELHYKILADGKEIGITRHRSTDGRPKYLVTCDELRHGDETFDVLATRGVGMVDWILARLPRPGQETAS